MKRAFLLLATTSILSATDDTLNLLEDLNNASQISTKTKLNVNKTPAVVSVLHASELQKLGITDLATALETVPGIEISMGIAGAKQINMRGNKSLVTDKLKFMIDGVSINAELSGANHFYLNMPIENIERIEIIRGPASSMYGSFAHIGVVNVITKAAGHKKNTMFIRGSSEQTNTLGFTQSLKSDNVKVALSGSFVDNNKEREYTNYSLIPNKSFHSYEDFSTKSLAMNLELYEDFTFTSRYLQKRTQNFFGYGAWPIVQDPKELEHTSFINEFVYAPKITKDLSLDLKLGYKSYSMKGQSRLVPYSILGKSYDLIGDGDYAEQGLYTDLSMHYKLAAHDIVFGTFLSDTKVRNSTYYTNNPAVSEEPTMAITGGGLQDGIERRQYALYLSDIYTISESFSANVGLRYDYYSDADDALTPKLALMYAYSEKQSYKLMYQNSFRAPSLVELYGTQTPFIGDSSLKSETIDTYEFAYRYQDTFDSWLSLNFFYTEMKNFIYRDADFHLKNANRANSYGGEIEFKIPLHETTTLQANYSYVHMQEPDAKQTPLIANHLANVMLSYQIANAWHTGSRVRYVGDRQREAQDSRDTLKSYTIFDQTLTYVYKEMTLQASVKNIFDSEVIYPAPVGDGSSSGTYMDDLHRDGRVFWLSAEWKIK